MARAIIIALVRDCLSYVVSRWLFWRDGFHPVRSGWGANEEWGSTVVDITRPESQSSSTNVD